MEPIANTKSPGLAAILSLFLPGFGQFYNGKIGKGIIFLIAGIIGWFTIIFGIVIGITGALDAYSDAKNFNSDIEVQEQSKNYSQNTIQYNPSPKEVDYFNGQEFVVKMQKNHKLFINDMYTEEEYNKNKSMNISSLASKTIKDKNDFLFSIISLKDDNIINEEDVKRIKALI